VFIPTTGARHDWKLGFHGCELSILPLTTELSHDPLLMRGFREALWLSGWSTEGGRFKTACAWDFSNALPVHPAENGYAVSFHSAIA